MAVIKRQTITAQVIDYILDLIRQGRVKPGERLPTEKDLTESLSVSRTCVREAVKSLESLGLISVRPRIGATVLEPSQTAILNAQQLAATASVERSDTLVEFRKVIEVGLAGLAAEKRTDADLEAMGRALDDHERAIKSDKLIHKADLAFHTALVDATKNPIAIMVMQTISRVFIERSRHLDEVPGVPEEGLVEHRKILRAIREQSPEKARHAMLQHIQTQERNARILQTTGQLDGGPPSDGHRNATRRGRPDGTLARLHAGSTERKVKEPARVG